MASNDFEVIMKKITAGLSGDAKADMKYLNEQMEAYKDHEYGIEIIRACGRLLYEIMPEDMKEELSAAVDKDAKGFDAALDEVKFNIYKKDYAKALKMLEEMVGKYEKLNMYADDAVSEYYDFSEIFEEILYTQTHKSEKEVRRSQIQYAAMYLHYGSLLFELKRYEEAELALKKAMRWNPANARIAFEHAETFKVRGMMKEYYDATMEIFKIAFRPAELARCYRNLGYFFVEIGEYQNAVCCEVFSLQFEKSEMVQSELYYISTKENSVDVDPDINTVKKCFDTLGIPFGPNADVLSFAYQLTKIWMERGDKEGAEYFISILLGFVEDENILKMAEQIKLM